MGAFTSIKEFHELVLEGIEEGWRNFIKRGSDSICRGFSRFEGESDEA